MTLLAISPSKKLYSYDAGLPGWADFPTQPPWTVQSTGSYFVAGLPNGRIIVDDGPNAGYFPDKYLHFNPSTTTWSQVQKPLPVTHPKVSFVLDNNLVVLASTSRVVDIWNGVSYSRAPAGMTSGNLRGIAASSSTDIWCTTDTTSLWHLEAGVWVNRWNDARIALGGANLFFKGVWYVDGAFYFISNEFTGYNGKISKWTPGGGFSLVALIGAPSPGNSTITCDIWARAADDIWVFGYWSNDEVWHWNGSTVTRKFEAPSRKLNFFYNGDHLIHGTDSTPYMFATTPDNGGAWYESTDTGASWAPLVWIDGNLLTGLGAVGTGQDYAFQSDETLVATDSVRYPVAAVDAQTSRPAFEPYEPVVDLNMVEARLTNRARYYISRGMHDGTSLQPVRFELGTGWENPRWGEPPKPSPDATEVANKVYEGSIWDSRMYSEEANASTLAIRCAGPEEPGYTPTELMVYAVIRNSPNPDENYREIPFANATFPSWFYTTDQRFITRIVLPLGYGARVAL